MKLNEVVSSNIKAVGFDDGDLIVEYLKGTKYKYKNVPEALFEDLLKSESKGKFLNANVKGKYEFERIA